MLSSLLSKDASLMGGPLDEEIDEEGDVGAVPSTPWEGRMGAFELPFRRDGNSGCPPERSGPIAAFGSGIMGASSSKTDFVADLLCARFNGVNGVRVV
jgi:hypothetical protein